MKVVLVVSHKSQQCGIHEWGLDAYDSLKCSSRYKYVYLECSSGIELIKSIEGHKRLDAILYNCSAGTTPWLNKPLVDLIRAKGIKQLGTNHTCIRTHPDTMLVSLLDRELVLDPTFIPKTVEEVQRSVAVPRLIKQYSDFLPLPEEFTIGCFGFGMENKGWVELLNKIVTQFSTAKVKFLIPFNSVVDPGGAYHALPTANKCKSVNLPKGIELEVSHEFLSKPDLIYWLSGNTINAFNYLPSKVGGISSVVDHALSSGRPLAITKAQMFRHLHSCSPSICMEDRSLVEICKDGTSPLTPFIEQWSEVKFIEFFDTQLDLLWK